MLCPSSGPGIQWGLELSRGGLAPGKLSGGPRGTPAEVLGVHLFLERVPGMEAVGGPYPTSTPWGEAGIEEEAAQPT